MEGEKRTKSKKRAASPRSPSEPVSPSYSRHGRRIRSSPFPTIETPPEPVSPSNSGHRRQTRSSLCPTIETPPEPVSPFNSGNRQQISSSPFPTIETPPEPVSPSYSGNGQQFRSSPFPTIESPPEPVTPSYSGHGRRTRTSPLQTSKSPPQSVCSSFPEQGRHITAESSSKTQDDQDNRTEHDSFANFDTRRLETGLMPRRILRNASIPSPLWSGALQWKPPTDNRLFNSAQTLYREIHSHRFELQEKVGIEANFHQQGRKKGLLCWWEYVPRTIDPREMIYYDSDDESGEECIENMSGDLKHAWVEDPIDLDINRFRSDNTNHEASTASKGSRICRLQRKVGVGNAQPDEFGHFIVNFNQASLSINGVPIGMRTVAGPLPEFTVIEIEGSLLFWWGTVAALDFVPEKQSTKGGLKRSFADLQGYENLADNHALVKRSKIERSTEGE